MLRPALPPAEIDDITEESVTVAEAARRLGCDPATVRALLRAGELSGHKIGKCIERRGDRYVRRKPGGVRIDAASIRDYKRRHAIGAAPANDTGRPRGRRPSGGHLEAKRWLRERGIIC